MIVEPPSSGGVSGIKSSGGTTKITYSDRIPPKNEKTPENPHEKGVKTFARYYANELAEKEIYKPVPQFSPGAIIVREKLLSADAATPELVTVMVKRETGFSRKTGDWEYFVVEGSLDKIRKREKKGSCAQCHAQAGQTDFVFRTYLK